MRSALAACDTTMIAIKAAMEDMELTDLCTSMTTAAFASRDVVDINIVKVSDRFIGDAVPMVQK